MSKTWDNWATIHRNWNAITTALFLLLTLILAWVLIHKEPAMVSTSHEIGIAKRVKRSTDEIHSIAHLEMSDDTEIVLYFIPHPIPEFGDKIPVIVKYYDNGKKSYSIDRLEWQMYGSM